MNYIKSIIKKMPIIGRILKEISLYMQKCIDLEGELGTLRISLNECSTNLLFHINLCKKLLEVYEIKPVLSIESSSDSSRKKMGAFNCTPEDYKSLCEKNKNELSIFSLKRYCLLCQRADEMFVDYQHALEDSFGNKIPNLREKISCQHCHMNNRQRLIAYLAAGLINKYQFKDVYLTEYITPIYSWIKKKFPNSAIEGSEYLSGDLNSGNIVNGVMHQDIMATSFGDDSFDLIISNDIFEHVPDPLMAFKECLRILRTGGYLIATIPFNKDLEKSIQRAKLFEGQIVNILPAQFHNNPVSEDGALVFYDYGWDLIDLMKSAGFSNVKIDVYSDDIFGHFGEPISIFIASK